MRRVGKTTLIFQLINHLITNKNTDPYHILYFSFDESSVELDELIDYYETNILKFPLSDNKKIYIFFDEIQKYRGWTNKIKILYDINPNIKLILSGSSNLFLGKGSKESLAGRFFEYLIKPLDFLEYLNFKDIFIDFNREILFKQVLIQTFNKYLKCGGFIEAMDFNTDVLLTKYFRESILESIVFKDIPEIFSIRTPLTLYRLIKIWAEYPGMYTDYKNLSNDLKVDQRTISNFVEYSEQSMIVKKNYNYSKNALTSEKKMKRIYLNNTAFSYAMVAGKPDLSRILEQYWVIELNSPFFYRSPRKEEIDIVYYSDKLTLPVEIKMRKKITKNDVIPMIHFLKKFELNRGLFITLDSYDTYTDNGSKISLIPYWRYHEIKKFIKSLEKITK